MEQFNQEYERYQRAQKQVNEIKGFYGNLAMYITVNLFLMFINLKYSPEYLWFFWPLLGWGIGVVFHGMKAFNYTPFLGREWEERKMKEFMDKEKQQNNGQ
ncbi:2TM domain-containing protein [Flavobacterium wongokense]|uniref:2TM domain-containing protein n=1 Tax=Flavobacterium wongokense TaxID=2910674 RepID=UPI001F1C8FB8|nr:2TM domain-containing protein [Flavobacterium sp. WG47]MCF6132579.1 2TM domain-containing protein [Flavobacterium sp. WG47]